MNRMILFIHWQVDLAIIREGKWSRPIPIFDVVMALIDLIDNPDLDYPMRADVMEEYKNDHEKFLATASMRSLRYALERPSEPSEEK